MATVTFKGTPVNLRGELPKVGGPAPKFGGAAQDLSNIHLSDYLGKKVVINIFPSIDTGVCAQSVRRFNQEAASLPDTVVLCVSKDLPFAHKRFCAAEGIENVVTVSATRCQHFDEGYGLTMTDGPLKGMLARAVIVVDTQGIIVYEELVPEVTNEPDYEGALKALRELK